jgi:hypothetical protein
VVSLKGTLLLVLACSLSPAAQVEEKLPPHPANVIGCVITLDKADWSSNKPANVSGAIDNISDHELELGILPSLELKTHRVSAALGTYRAQEESYWAPADLFEDKPLETDRDEIKKGVLAISPKALHLKLPRNGTAKFTLDASKLKWARTVSSIWPDQPLFTVVPSGTYDLTLVIETSAYRFRSNHVKVEIKSSE